MPAPTLGCQIAPHYHTDPESDDDDSTLEEDYVSQLHGEGVESSTQDTANNSGELATPLSIEKAETQRDVLGAGRISRPATLGNRRTKSNRSQVPPAPVGFWCWQMVCLGFTQYMNGLLTMI